MNDFWEVMLLAIIWDISLVILTGKKKFLEIMALAMLLTPIASLVHFAAEYVESAR